MPLYGQGLLSAPYKVPKTLTVKEINKFHKILRDSMRTFTYYNDQSFLSEIKIVNKVFILAHYNFGRPSVISSSSTIKLEALIKEMNSKLPKEFGHKANNYKIDIAGNWDVGNIVVLVKNDNCFLNSKPKIVKSKNE
jgi:hypothetical protein